MGVVVFDANVLVGFLDDTDRHHGEAVTLMRGVLDSRAARWLCATTLTEILVKPVEAGTHGRVDGMLGALGFDIKQVDRSLAQLAAAVRAKVKPKLRLPDASALATAIHAEHQGFEDVELATFGERLKEAHRRSRADPRGGGFEGTV